jgi:hypothetical protein
MGYVGLGDAVSDAMDNVTGMLSSSITTLSSGVSSADIAGVTSQFAWEDWALLGIGGLVFLEMVGRSGRAVGGGVTKKYRGLKSGARKRGRGAKTFFTGS